MEDIIFNLSIVLSPSSLFPQRGRSRLETQTTKIGTTVGVVLLWDVLLAVRSLDGSCGSNRLEYMHDERER